MDSSMVERHTELLTIDVDSRLSGTKLNGNTVVVTTDSAETQELIGTQYMTIDRIPENQLSTDLLNQQVVELMQGNEFVSGTVGNQYYDDDLLPHDLTEDDKRLAAALVAVQFVQQQKQQHTSILATELLNGKSMSPLPTLQNVSMDKPGMAAMVTSYIQAFDDETATQQQLIDTQNHERIIKLYQAPTAAPTPQPQLPEELEGKGSGGSAFKGSEDHLPTEESDLEMETDLKSSRKSLPHKKRIPRKLKTQLNRSLHTKGANSSPVTKRTAFSCEICGVSSINQAKFFEHLKEHYEPPLQGTSGTYETNKEDPGQQVEVDKAGGESEAMLSCGICGREFKRQKALETHMATAHPQIEEFSEPEDLMEGIRHVVNIQTEAAEESDKMRWKDDFGSDFCSGDGGGDKDGGGDLSDFPEDEGTGKGKKKKKLVHCPHCSRTFTHRNSFLYHVRSLSGRRLHQCDVCGKGFFAANALRVHMRMHSGDKPYKCEVCGRDFRQWGDLKYHMTSLHSNTKQYQCEFCGKDFARKYSLIVHRRIHTGEKNYVCEFCRKTFRASSYLVNHRRIHTGEKPYNCDVCHKPFRVKSDMKRHRNIHNKASANGGGAVGNTSASQSGVEPPAPPLPDPLDLKTDEFREAEDYRQPPPSEANTLYVWVPAATKEEPLEEAVLPD